MGIASTRCLTLKIAGRVATRAPARSSASTGNAPMPVWGCLTAGRVEPEWCAAAKRVLIRRPTRTTVATAALPARNSASTAPVTALKRRIATSRRRTGIPRRVPASIAARATASRMVTSVASMQVARVTAATLGRSAAIIRLGVAWDKTNEDAGVSSDGRATV